MDIGYKDDDLFLLSKKEYEQYKNKIPPEACWWWLRNFGPRKNRAVIHCCGYPIDVVVSVSSVVRPALKYSNNDYETSGIRRKLLKWFETGTWNYA